MANVFTNAYNAVYNAFLFLITKTMVFFGSLFASTSFFAGFQRTRAIDIIRYERDSEDLGSIRLSRFETPEQTFIYGKFLGVNSETLYKGVLRQNKAAGAKTQAYLYTDHEENPDIIQAVRFPFPISVSFLDTVFDHNED